MTRCSEVGLRRLPGRQLRGDYFRQSTLEVARELLGCVLARREPDGTFTGGSIVETEAYVGESDPACHAAAGRTPRTVVLYGPPGRTYVYFSYGMHHLLNVVCEPAGFPAAVLIRALRPEFGLAAMRRRRKVDRVELLASGPGRLCQALGVDLALNDRPLGAEIQLRSKSRQPDQIRVGPRIGISKGTERPWRFLIAGEGSVSPGFSRPSS